MAERRMFAKTIIDSDAFIDMPLSTQALYFHLSMRADDDGFINNSKRIQRMIGASDDDLKLLFVKNFVIPFESGVVVIKHWKLHNYIQNDRYKETVYLEEKKLLETKKNKVYTLVDTNCIQNGYTGKDRIVKNSIDKNSIENNIVIANANDNVSKSQFEEEFETIWKEYPRKQGKANALKAYIKTRKKGTTYEEVLIGLENYVKYITIGKIESQYIKQGSTWFNQECWNDDYTIKEKESNRYKPIRKEVVPEWINKDIKAERVTEEERKELEDILKEFNNP